MKNSTYFISIACIVLLFMACDRYPLKVDFEMATGTIIGQEKCNAVDSLNAWLLALTPLDSTKVYGSTLTIDGKIYKNVVKTYQLDRMYRDSTKTYGIEFYLQAPTATTCTVSDPQVFQTQEIRIKIIAIKG